MNKVGFIDLSDQSFKLEKQIEQALRSRWLDSDTHYEFKKRIFGARKHRGGLERLLKDINKEIEWRQKNYGAHEPRNTIAR